VPAVIASDRSSPRRGDTFWKSFAQKTVGDLFEFVAHTCRTAILVPDQSAYEDIVAVMLKANGFPRERLN